MRVLGIETSCDETAVAVYDSAAGLLSHRLYSQVSLHQAYGGVVPELASRDHVKRLLPLVREALEAAATLPGQIDGVAYTAGPGLIGALLVGAGFARSLAYAWGAKAIPVHHLEGHLLSPFLGADPPEFPFVALLVSGGHTQLMRVDGVAADVKLSAVRVDSEGEGVVEWFLSDITEDKQREAIRAALSRDLEEKNRELEAIVYAASHDLRSPLLNVMGFSQQLDTACKQIASLETAATQLAALLQAGDNHGLQPGARGIDGGSIASRARADDQDWSVLDGHVGMPPAGRIARPGDF